MESIRDSLAEELVKMTAQVSIVWYNTLICLSKHSSEDFQHWVQCEKLQAEAAMLPGIRAELDALRRRHSAALELMGERDEEVRIF